MFGNYIHNVPLILKVFTTNGVGVKLFIVVDGLANAVERFDWVVGPVALVDADAAVDVPIFVGGAVVTAAVKCCVWGDVTVAVVDICAACGCPVVKWCSGTERMSCLRSYLHPPRV